jgi:hypothetical protein
LQDLDFWTGLGFALIALATAENTFEPFFAWRSRWVLMEEAQYEFYRLRDDATFDPGLSAKSFPQLGGDVGRAGAAVVQGVSGRQALVV